MPNNEIFSGIPSLDDTQGLENLLNQQTLDGFGLNTQVPTALEQQPTEPATPAAPASEPVQQVAPTYTAEQVAELVSRNQQLEAQLQQTQQPVARTQHSQPHAPLYNERQIGIINQLLARGVSIEQIAAHMARARGGQQVNEVTLQRLQNIEAYLQQQQYAQAESEFIQKMTTFGDKFGLSEQELVTFGNVALSKGIDVSRVTDLEAVFRAIYPDQYALRLQRINNANNSAPIYGGASVAETPRASASKLEDAYVDAFLKQAMPNQYGRKN